MLAQVQSGRALGAAAGGGAGAAGAVRRRAARPRRAAPAGRHELAEPALLLLLRRDLFGAGDPRRAARGDAEPGRDRLARVAGLDRARAAGRRLGAAAARPPRRLARPHRGHGLDVDARRAHRCAPCDRPQRRRLLRARALLGREGRADARDGAAQGAGRRGAADARGRLRPRRRRRCRRDRRHDLVRLGRPGARARRAGARGRRVAPRRRGVRRLLVDLRGGALVGRRRRARRQPRRQPAQVAARARPTARSSGRRARTSGARRSR